MRQLGARLAKDESGATAIEYGLIAALISVTIIGVLYAVGGNLNTKMQEISDAIANAGS
jgi:pilus assembly protein Flp/PilA